MTARRLIAVDIGNSSTKVGWLDAADAKREATVRLPAIADAFDYPTGAVPGDTAQARLPQEPCTWHIASVHREGAAILCRWIQQSRPADAARVLSCRDLPIDLQVEFPERVGLDRLAAAVAANAIRDPGRPAIVVDAGSAITVDFVSDAGAFQGGVIMPGFRMAAEALYGKADLLPLTILAPNDQPPPVLGKNTEQAIRSGLFWGAVGSVREIVHRLSSGLAPQPQVFVTGGDLRRLAEQLGGEARYVPNMVLAGIAIAATSRNKE